ADADYDTPEAEAQREKSRAAMEKRFAETGRWPGSTPTPTGRRRSSIPVIEIARAETKAEAEAALERWEEAHPDGGAPLEPADILTDGMRGRSSLWYRLRVNLIHVPEDQRPPQEPLLVDYDPWAGYAWPDRSGQLERAARTHSDSDEDATGKL